MFSNSHNDLHFLKFSSTFSDVENETRGDSATIAGVIYRGLTI
jgi:hypothetical protein